MTAEIAVGASSFLEHALPVAAIGGVFAGVYKIFDFVQDRASPELKKQITERLKTYQLTSFADELISFHNTLFGAKQLSLRCFLSVVACSFFITSILIIFCATLHKEFFEDLIKYYRIAINITLFTTFVCIIPTDFIGVLITRYILNSFLKSNSSILRVSLSLACDIICKTTLIILIMSTYNYFILSIDNSSFVSMIVFELNSIVCNTFIIPCEFYIIPILSVLLTSMWVWIFGACTIILQYLKFFFDVENQPITSIGTLAAIFCSLIYVLALGIAALLNRDSGFILPI